MAISLAVVCTQIQLGYGIMAASVTVLKPFMAVYEKPTGSYTGYTGGTRNNKNVYGTGNSNHQSFKLASVVRTRDDGSPPSPHREHINNGRTTPAATAAANPTFPQSRYEVTAVAGHNSRRRGSDGGHEKGDSIHSHDSRRLIIERKTDWSVRYEDSASQKSAASETGGSS